MFKIFLRSALLALVFRAHADHAAALTAYQTGLVKMKAKDYAGATVEFRVATHEDPDFDEALLQMANSLYGKGEKEKAVSAYEDYLAKKPGDAKVQAFLKSIRDAADRDKPLGYAAGAEKCYVAGLGFMKAKDYKKAIACFVEGLGYDHSMFEADLQLGNCYYYNGDKAKAIQAYEAYLKLKPGDAKVQGYVKALRKG